MTFDERVQKAGDKLRQMSDADIMSACGRVRGGVYERIFAFIALQAIRDGVASITSEEVLAAVEGVIFP